MGLKASMTRFQNPTVVPPCSPRGFICVEKQRRRLSFICTVYVCADDLMKAHGSIRDIKKWCGKRTNPILRCFDNLEGLNYGVLLVGVVHELANDLRLGTMVPS
jgi:hypothetical protein